MKILYVTTISLTMNSFFKPHIEMLVREGHRVDIACNMKELALDPLYDELGCTAYQIDFSRSPLSPENVKAFGQLDNVIEKGNYDIVHCHTPNASVVTRLVCRKYRKRNGLKVFYTAHGFHFYKGAPKLNWLVFYPVEKICSVFTDKLITINKEDYELAKSKLHAGEVHYVPGVGVDLSRFENIQVDRNAKRHEIGVPEDVTLLVSVGELSERKNHRVVLRALGLIDDPKIHYMIVGKGPLDQQLRDDAVEYNIADRVHFMGYRTDIAQLYKASDVCCFPSIHEGLPVALIEAMACGVPAVCSRIRGNTDLIDDRGGALFAPHSVEECRQAIIEMLHCDRTHMGQVNRSCAQNYSVDKIVTVMKSIYES